MAASASASPLHCLSLTLRTLSLSKPNTSFSSLCFPFSSLKLSVSSSSSSSIKPFLNSRFARNVAVSSEFDQIESAVDREEDDNVFGSAEDGVEEASYSPDLKVFVGNLPFTVDSAALAGLFERAGSVELVEVIYDKVTGRSRGFGFVTMSTPQEVEAAVREFNGYDLEGRLLRVNSGPPPPKGGSSSFRGARGGSSNFNTANRVYVGNLAWGVDNLALENLFSEQGRVIEAKVVYDRESGRSRGFGFVTYSSADEVNNAIEALDGADLDGRPIRVNPAEARQRRQF